MDVRQYSGIYYGGNPWLAQVCISWLFYHFENTGANKDGNVDVFIWPAENILLQGHTTTGEAVSINSVSCMGYLTANTDPIKILTNSIIKAEIELLWKLRGVEPPIDLNVGG